jgi:ParB-like nuclease domain
MTQNIQLSKIKPNTGQIEGLPANPRFIRDEKFDALKKSLQDDPEMLELRELIVFPLGKDVVIIGGNMRFRAAEELGFKELPCKVLSPDTPIEKLRAITIKDNVPFGQWDMDILANEWDMSELEGWGMDLPFSGTDADPEDFFKDEEKKDKEPRMVVCPHCGKEHEL